jgi:2-oxo-4-hydroxy-4-carboxy--5-ureidoimidazoline (OHCU) decarboxylase
MLIMTKKSSYVAKMETQLKNWNSDVDALAAEGEKAKGKARAAYGEQVKNLRACNDAAQKAFVAIQAASDSAAEQMQVGMEEAWKSMQKMLKKVSCDLRK